MVDYYRAIPSWGNGRQSASEIADCEHKTRTWARAIVTQRRIDRDICNGLRRKCRRCGAITEGPEALACIVDGVCANQRECEFSVSINRDARPWRPWTPIDDSSGIERMLDVYAKSKGHNDVHALVNAMADQIEAEAS